jgi:1-pyrroline-5-carboxylate dehydrogenase
MITQQELPKVTYTTMSVEQAEAFHAAFDEALEKVRSQLGQTWPLIIGGTERMTATQFTDTSPNDRRVELGRFQHATVQDVADAVQAARQAFNVWGELPYQERVAILERVADNFRTNRFTLAALLSLEAGKPRLEAVGEVEEAADLITTYCEQMLEHRGYVLKLKQLTPQEVNHSVLRPYGAWAVIAPFNFPIALATGMIAGALVAGNTVVFKPATDTPYTGLMVYRMFAEAGLPFGTMNFITGGGGEIGRALVENPQIDGIVFTGSKEVGYSILQRSLLAYPRPCIAEMGGKNPVLVMESADLDKAVVGTARAAFGYSGQKCSAASRIYVHHRIKDRFVERLVEYTRGLVVGDPTQRDTFMGPVINERAYQKFIAAANTAAQEGRILSGGHTITEGDRHFGYYVEPTIVDGLPTNHRFFQEELFVPLIVIAGIGSLEEGLRLANESEFGLCAGLFSEDEQEHKQFFQRMEAGVLYINRAGGATTGAWPGVQSFGGWKASGSTGKNALGPYYVQQFMHEQNQTIVTS